MLITGSYIVQKSFALYSNKLSQKEDKSSTAASLLSGTSSTYNSSILLLLDIYNRVEYYLSFIITH
jgi:hypothetical protein